MKTHMNTNMTMNMSSTSNTSSNKFDEQIVDVTNITIKKMLKQMQINEHKFRNDL